MKAVRTSLIAALALMLSAGALLARSYERPTDSSRVADVQSSVRRSGLSLDQAVRMAQQRFRARVVRAETQTEGGRTIYLLRMLDDAGRVFAVRVDAASGTIL